jgi:hypothetical protein
MLTFVDESEELVEEITPVENLLQINRTISLTQFLISIARILASTSTSATATANIPISAPGLAAYIISLLCIWVIYYGNALLNDIKTPARFYNKQFVVGEIQA